MSAPARSIDETAMSTSRVSITCSIGMRCTSTSNIDRSIVSGLRPCDIVRLPCGSRSISSTRWPCSANATPRLSVVVVFATPPFWFASAITCVAAGAVRSQGERWDAEEDARDPCGSHFGSAYRIPSASSRSFPRPPCPRRRPRSRAHASASGTSARSSPGPRLWLRRTVPAPRCLGLQTPRSASAAPAPVRVVHPRQHSRRTL